MCRQFLKTVSIFLLFLTILFVLFNTITNPNILEKVARKQQSIPEEYDTYFDVLDETKSICFLFYDKTYSTFVYSLYHNRNQIMYKFVSGGSPGINQKIPLQVRNIQNNILIFYNGRTGVKTIEFCNNTNKILFELNINDNPVIKLYPARIFDDIHHIQLRYSQNKCETIPLDNYIQMEKNSL